MGIGTPGVLGAPTVTITADPAHPRAISPWIYGINFYDGYGYQPLSRLVAAPPFLG